MTDGHHMKQQIICLTHRIEWEGRDEHTLSKIPKTIHLDNNAICFLNY